MGFSRRKLTLGNDPYVSCQPLCDPLLNKQGLCSEPCCKICPKVCKYSMGFGVITHPPPFLPPHTYPPPILPSPPPMPEVPVDSTPNYSRGNAQKHLIQMSMIVGSCMIGASLLLCLVFAIMRLYSNRRNPRRRSSPILFSIGEDFLDEDQHGPVLDHPIWYIHTVGLSQALIDSITVCKYRKDEGLIEGTDCSVCLSEFEEDESLRLLPKCSHAFHIPCIDSWLRSHKNCPLCRAPVVCGDASDQMSDSTASGSGTQESIRVEISESIEGFGRGTSEVGVTDDDNVGANLVDGRSVESSKVLPNSILADEGSCEPRAFSDLADNRRVTEDEVQPMRRSVSVDSMSASRIYSAVANVIPEEGSSNSELVLVKNPKLGNVAKQENASSSVSRHWRSSPIGISLQMVPMAMKKPFPSGGRLFSSKHRRTLSSVLPL